MSDRLPPSSSFISFEDEMRRSYLDYAMSVIVARALPDVRDGLKPVHRRILYTMKEGGYDWNRPLRKSARIVGDVMGKFHPHGDNAIYDSMVRMAQDFSMRLRLVEGQGNFGSIDGDAAAAMRYTEARLERSASQAMLQDIDKDTVDFRPNYDETDREPIVLPARLPNLLINGAGGIAVGMATNIPPHNLGETIRACIAMLTEPDLDDDQLFALIPGPDFPTGAVIFGTQGIRDAQKTGRGRVLMRAVVNQEKKGEREQLVVSEIPYQVNKSRLLERIAQQAQAGNIEGIATLRDESDRHGLRIVVELKRGAVPEIVENQLYKHSDLQTSFSVNTVALHHGRPQLMNLRGLLTAFIAFRQEVVRRRTIFDLAKARATAHNILGLVIAVTNLDKVISLIRNAKDPATAKAELVAHAWPVGELRPLLDLTEHDGSALDEKGNLRLSPAQAQAILDLRLHRLTGLEREKLLQELHRLAEVIAQLLAVLDHPGKLVEIVREELEEVEKLFADPRRTQIVEGTLIEGEDDLIADLDMVVTVTVSGYIKRVPLTVYRAQNRGGKGRAGMISREEDPVARIFACTNLTPLLFFSSKGRVYRLKAYRLPQAAPRARGKAIVNLLPLASDERITAVLPWPTQEQDDLSLVFATSSGSVRRNKISDFAHVPSGGKVAMSLKANTLLIAAEPCLPNQHILLTTTAGRAVRFAAEDIRLFVGRTSTGVRGIRLEGEDRVIGLAILDADPKNQQAVLSVSDDGLGKRTAAKHFPVNHRGGKGVAATKLSRSDGRRQASLVASFPVEDCDSIIAITDAGRLIRCQVNGIRRAGRSTQGVRILSVKEGERLVSVSRLEDEDKIPSEP